MGLAERRAVKAFQDEKYPALKAEIDQAAGFAVETEVQWDTLAKEDYAHLYDEAFEKVFFRPLIDALNAVSFDDMGKEALKDGLKKITIRSSGTSEVRFTGGVLLFDKDSMSNLDYGNERKAELQKALEKGL